jgi:prepilin-type processing-associated H-X9-DG protein
MNRFPTGSVVGRGGQNNHGSRYTWRRALDTYVKSLGVWTCASNQWIWSDASVNGTKGDDSNADPKYKDRQIPTSYAYNGSYFHEAMPAGDTDQRPREQSEIKDPTGLILILESRAGHPDLGDWCIRDHCADSTVPANMGSFQTHQGRCNWIFADTHAKSYKLAETVQPKQMWCEYGDPKTTANFQTTVNGYLKTALNTYKEYK